MTDQRPIHNALTVLNNSSNENRICCGSAIEQMTPRRREFLKLAGVGLVGTVTGSPAQVMAGNFTPEDVRDGHLVPADKKFDPAWIESLFARGNKEVYRNDSLENIGMPCGGIGSGQLYLRGDGTLGEWQIFNRAVSHWVKETNATYQHRGIDQSFAQGFALSVQQDRAVRQEGDSPPKEQTEESSQVVRHLSRDGFDQVTFQGEYKTPGRFGP